LRVFSTFTKDSPHPFPPPTGPRENGDPEGVGEGANLKFNIIINAAKKK